MCSITRKPPWRNRLARSAVNRKVGGSSPPGGGSVLSLFFFNFFWRENSITQIVMNLKERLNGQKRTVLTKLDTMDKNGQN